MKLHATPTQQYQTVTGYDDDWIEINAIQHTSSLIVLPEVAPVVWPVQGCTGIDFVVSGLFLISKIPESIGFMSRQTALWSTFPQVL